MNLAHMRNLGAYLKPIEGPTSVTATAAGSGDNTDQKGTAIDRLAEPGKEGPYEAIIGIAQISCTLATNESAVCTLRVQHSDDTTDGNFSDYTDEFGNGLATKTIVDGADEKDILKVYCSLLGAKRYVRLVAKVNLSASGTDTATLTAMGFLAGGKSEPV